GDLSRELGGAPRQVACGAHRRRAPAEHARLDLDVLGELLGLLRGAPRHALALGDVARGERVRRVVEALADGPQRVRPAGAEPGGVDRRGRAPQLARVAGERCGPGAIRRPTGRLGALGGPTLHVGGAVGERALLRLEPGETVERLAQCAVALAEAGVDEA